jgi:hypothetical protein
MSRAQTIPVVAIHILLGMAILPGAGSGQETGEPIYDELMALVTQDALTIGTLFQAVVDPSIDSDDAQSANISVAAARLLMGGVLDNGFRYFLQTNFAASPSVLDARVGWVYDDQFGVWAGRFKTPFNQELIDYAGSIDLVNRSRVVSQLGTDRQYGVQIATRVGIATLQLGGFTGPNAAPSGEDLAGVARVAIVPDIGEGHTIRAGASAAISCDGAVGGRSLGAGYDGSASLFELDARYERDRRLAPHGADPGAGPLGPIR